MARVLVLGSSNTDLTVRLPRLPEPGQTVLGGALLTGPGGKGANQAVAAARAGGRVVFLTALGDDDLGRQALDGYRSEGVDVTHAQTIAGEPSGVALILVGERGENLIGVAPGANLRLGPEDVDRLPSDLFEAGRLLLVAGLEVPTATALRAAERAAGASMTVVLNPAPVPPDLAASGLLALADLLTPNRVELGQIAGIETETEAGVAAACRALRVSYPRLDLVVTLGAVGCYIDSNGYTGPVAAFPVPAEDTVGAGDAFNGALAVALAEGRPLPDSVGWASAAAALAVTRPGAQPGLPFRTEIDLFAAGRSD